VDVGRTTQLHERVERPRSGLHLTAGFGLRGNTAHFLDNRRNVFEQGNGVAVALTHLIRTVGTRHLERVADVHLRNRENFPGEHVVEATGEIPRHLDMLSLILSHGDTVSTDTENVRSHQYRVAEQTVTNLAFGNALVVDAILERGAVLEPTKFDNIAQEDSDFTDFWDVALPVEGRFGRVDTTGEVVFGHLDRQRVGLRQTSYFGQSVNVGDEEETLFTGGFQIQELLDRTEVVAQVQVARRTHARQNS